jgi:hypothetical protein
VVISHLFIGLFGKVGLSIPICQLPVNLQHDARFGMG